MSKFCFVVLHYKTWWDTIECVDSMLETTYQDKHIIIVNNDEDDVSQKKIIGGIFQ
jgi:GT2 family glycosyltransferase